MNAAYGSLTEVTSSGLPLVICLDEHLVFSGQQQFRPLRPAGLHGFGDLRQLLVRRGDGGLGKATGRHLLHEHPVIKPTGWGCRGCWPASGGIGFAFPVEARGLNEWRPWTYNISANRSTASVTVSGVEDRTGMTAGATVSLDTAHDYVVIEPWVQNDPESEQTYQYWINAMVTLADNCISGRTHLVFPTDPVIVHSTGDPSLPGAWQPMTWPIYEGQDLKPR